MNERFGFNPCGCSIIIDILGHIWKPCPLRYLHFYLFMYLNFSLLFDNRQGAKIRVHRFERRGIEPSTSAERKVKVSATIENLGRWMRAKYLTTKLSLSSQLLFELSNNKWSWHNITFYAYLGYFSLEF